VRFFYIEWAGSTQFRENVEAGEGILLLECDDENSAEDSRYLFGLLVKNGGNVSMCHLRPEEAFYQIPEHLIGEEFGAKGEGDDHQNFPTNVEDLRSIHKF
jgi:hypothetical protein